VLKKIRVWDLPTRVFHWALVLCIVGLFATGLTGGSWIIWHERIAYVAFTLILFRLLWGVFGSETSRFTDFLRGPSAVIGYLKTGRSPTHGHSPIGGWAVFAMLAALVVQICTGLIVDDEIANKGPLADKVPGAWVSLATTIHRYGKYVLGGLIALHLCAIAFYTVVKKQPLIRPMVDGTRDVNAADATQPRMREGVAPWVLLAVCAAFVYWVVQIYPK
jgi:cytochrome b